MENRPLILIAEDDPDFANLMALHLRRCDYQTLLVADGPTAVRAAFALHPDLIVLDLLLPEQPGLAVCQALKLIENTCDIPILVETALADEEQFTQSTRAGAGGFLTKPFAMAEFVANVRAMLPLPAKCGGNPPTGRCCFRLAQAAGEFAELSPFRRQTGAGPGEDGA